MFVVGSRSGGFKITRPPLTLFLAGRVNREGLHDFWLFTTSTWSSSWMFGMFVLVGRRRGCRSSVGERAFSSGFFSCALSIVGFERCWGFGGLVLFFDGFFVLSEFCLDFVLVFD